MNPQSTAERRGFQSGVWPDALAFAVGLGIAWWQAWSTTDLVWSLWLSSLVVGWATIVWSIYGPMVFIGTKAWQDRHLLAGVPLLPSALAGGAFAIGGLFMLAFFTVHFGGFHFVHSVFLQSFFPIPGGPELRGGPNVAEYSEVVRRYWIFLPVAFLAERHAFQFGPGPLKMPDISVKAADIEARKQRNAQKGGMTGLMAPYKNVIRMHLLIFFFFAAHFLHWENFFVYAVVYCVYFFPWRILRERKTTIVSTG